MTYLDPTLLLLLIACVYILMSGGLSLLRREGLSVQFALETAALTLILVGSSHLLGVKLNPFVFVLLLYVITMRSRLTVDLANLLARRGDYGFAFRLYDLALAWWPDPASRLIALTNRGVAELYSGQIDAAIETLESVLEAEKRPRLNLKYEAACLYNLGFAYEKNGLDSKAVASYNEAIDLLPGSLYAQAAESALRRRRKKNVSG